MHVFAFNRNQKRSESKANNASRVRRITVREWVNGGMRGGGSVSGATAEDMLDDDFVYLL